MIDPGALSRMGVGTVNNAIASIEMDLRALEREIRVFDATPKRDRTEREVLNNINVEAVHQRLTLALAELRSLSGKLTQPLPQVHDGSNPNCSTCRSVRIINSI